MLSYSQLHIQYKLKQKEFHKKSTPNSPVYSTSPTATTSTATSTVKIMDSPTGQIRKHAILIRD